MKSDTLNDKMNVISNGESSAAQQQMGSNKKKKPIC